MNKPKTVYICTPLSEGKFNLEKISKTIIHENVFAFIPPQAQLQSREIGANLDRKMIDFCDEVWAFGPIGRDCSWELGYAQGLGKPTRIYLDKSNEDMVKDSWMMPLGCTFIIGELDE